MVCGRGGQPYNLYREHAGRRYGGQDTYFGLVFGAIYYHLDFSQYLQPSTTAKNLHLHLHHCYYHHHYALYYMQYFQAPTYIVQGHLPRQSPP